MLMLVILIPHNLCVVLKSPLSVLSVKQTFITFSLNYTLFYVQSVM